MSSPFFTMPYTSRRQLVIPMGTAHACAQCGNSYICDSARCAVAFGALCQTCNTAAVVHSLAPENIDAGWVELPAAREIEPQAGLFDEVKP